MKRGWIVVAMLVWTLSTAAAQDKRAAASKALLENQNLRVTEVTVKPGGTLVLQDHAVQFIYALTDGSLVFSPAGKTSFEVTLTAGEASLLPSQSAHPVNGGDKDIKVVLVEFKQAVRATPAAKVKSKAKAKIKTGKDSRPSMVIDVKPKQAQ